MMNDQQDSQHFEKYLSTLRPDKIPLPFTPSLIAEDQLIHRGIFSPDFKNYYFTVSDKNFSQFDVKMITQKEGRWSKAQAAFFNSEFNEHGMSFSPDGKTLFFSSTRPVAQDGVAASWHIWKTELKGNEWSEAVYVDIPNLSGRLCSHPTVTADGTLYYHSSKPDYSEMDLYYSRYSEGRYSDGEKLKLPGVEGRVKCTPFIAADENFLLFALLGESLELAVTYRTGDGTWGPIKKLPAQVNTKGQGNPYLSPDGQFLFYAVEDSTLGNWEIRWVGEEVIPKH